MKTIYKYKLMPTETQKVELPFDAEVLSAAYVNGDMVIYALVDPKSIGEKFVEVLVYGTGHDIEKSIEEYKFLNTVQIAADGLVFHVFYKTIHSSNFV
ncbi:hypothetical protein D3C74_342310 [compost metagenome]